jgi:hypothetical protein
MLPEPLPQEVQMNTKQIISLLFAATLLLISATSHAVSTTITVRVISKGAKFVGTSMGGVQITIQDVLTKEVLATGITQGSTGATDRIMKTPANRNAVFSDETSARFTTAIDISQPTWIEVRAYGPLAQIQSANTVASTQWVIPGKHIDGGDAWLLELPGFVVDILAPPAHSSIKKSPAVVAVQASVTMMCGCPIVPGGLWDAGKYEVSALVKKDGKDLESVPLAFGGAPSQFSGSIPVRGPGVYEVAVYAYDASNGNTGIDRVTYIVE